MVDVLDFFELCSVGDWQSVRQVLENGRVDVNYQHKMNGWTALHWASRRGHKTIVELLLKHGANPSLVDVQGRSPADVAPDHSIADLLGGSAQSSSVPDIPIVPNYLQDPVFMHSKKPIGTVRSVEIRGDDTRDKSPNRVSVSSLLFCSGICAVGIVVLALVIRQRGMR